MRKFGTTVIYRKNTDILAKFKRVQEMGIETCQLDMWQSEMFDDEHAKEVLDAIAETGVEVTGLWAGWDGPCEWNFIAGPVTIGLVPAAYRYARLNTLKKASLFAEKIGVNQVITHVGFLPNSPADPDYIGTIGALKNLCQFMKARGQYFLFETGQETPVTLLRAIQDIGTGNVGINLDTGNLILYGMGNPLDALDVFGQYVMNTHMKDGFYPTDGRSLGKQAPLGEGKANIPAIVRKLEEIGYTGPFTIEREISDEDQQRKDILLAKEIILNA